MLKKAVFIIGPTGIGKTDIGLRLAENFDGEIISADSRQIYRFMDIGTDKPPNDYFQKVPHHFINILDPDEHYNASQFGKDVRLKTDEIIKHNKLPFIIGGSGLYLKSIVTGFFEETAKDQKTKRNLQERLRAEGKDLLYSELLKIDHEYASKISHNDAQRIVRGLEVYYVTGKPLSEHWKSTPSRKYFDEVTIGLNMERDRLYDRINIRVETMLERGLVNEVKGLLDKGYLPDLNSLQTYGYRETFQFLNGEISLEELKTSIQKSTRNFAKRQLTWFKKMDNVQWLDVDEDLDKTIQKAAKIIRIHISEN